MRGCHQLRSRRAAWMHLLRFHTSAGCQLEATLGEWRSRGQPGKRQHRAECFCSPRRDTSMLCGLLGECRLLWSIRAEESSRRREKQRDRLQAGHPDNIWMWNRLATCVDWMEYSDNGQPALSSDVHSACSLFAILQWGYADIASTWTQSQQSQARGQDADTDLSR